MLYSGHLGLLHTAAPLTNTVEKPSPLVSLSSLLLRYPWGSQTCVFLLYPLQSSWIISCVLVHIYICTFKSCVRERGEGSERWSLGLWHPGSLWRVDIFYAQDGHCVRLRESLRFPSLKLPFQALLYVAPSCANCCPPGGGEPSCHMEMNTPLPHILPCFLRRWEGKGRTSCNLASLLAHPSEQVLPGNIAACIPQRKVEESMFWVLILRCKCSFFYT